MTVHIGDTVERRTVTFSGDPDAKARTMRGVVVYVHPEGRFHVVEFPIAKPGPSRGLTAGVRDRERRGTRESFFGVET